MILEVNNLRFSYPNQEVLTGVSFNAAAGECLCLLGENGAGKTTLFRCLLGLLNGYTGEILIDGVSSKKLSIRETAKTIAYIPQAHAPAFNYSVFDTVLMGTNPHIESYRTPSIDEQEVTQNALKLLKIDHLSERGYAQISGGERQLVLIARAIAQQTRVLVMDEPTAHLDYGNQIRVMRQVRQLAQQGYLIVLSTHNPEHALLYADNVLVLKQGKVLTHGPPASALTPEVIQRIYGVSVELITLQSSIGSVPALCPCPE